MPRAVILTSLPVEYLAVRDHLTDLQEEIHPQGTIYEQGRFTGNSSTWDVGIAEIGAGNPNTAGESERAIAHFNPDLLFFVGIAGSLNHATVGDVIAATKVYGYESGKVDNQFLTRPEVGQSAYSLVQRARFESKQKEWLQRIKSDDVPTELPRVHIAPIATGEKVITSKRSEMLRFLGKSYNDALAVDLGSYGFLNAAFAYSNKDAIVIRGIHSSITSETDKPLDPVNILRRQQAAHHASAFAFQVLSKIKLPTQSEQEYTNYPVAIEDGNVYIASPEASEQAGGLIKEASDRTQYTIEELTKDDYHNLPKPSYKNLVGREKDLKDLLYRLSPEFHERIITVAGIGGVGKTSLVLEAAYACLAAKRESGNTKIPVFDIIVFSSAKLTSLSPKGIVPNKSVQRPIKTLPDLCIDIDKILEKSGLRVSDPKRQIPALQDFLSRQDCRILIILDNLEALREEDTHKIREFLKKIKGNHIKTVITTRNSDSYDLSLKQLSRDASLQMIDNLLSERKRTAGDDFRQELSFVCGGVPLAIDYAIGVFELERNAQKVLDKLRDPGDIVCEYCFKQLVEEIKARSPIAFKLFLTLSISAYGLTRENLLWISGISDDQEDEAEYALSILRRCSLVFSVDDRYQMLPLTRKYSLSLLKNNSSDELKVREALISRYLDIAQRNGGEDNGEWHEKYDAIDKEWSTFKEVFLWCQNHEKYEEARQLWASLNRFAYLYCYWSDRLEWSHWLMDIANQRGDKGLLAELKSACGWLTMLREGQENFQKAQELLNSAWYFSRNADPYIRNVISINLAVLFSRKRDFKEADRWFRKYMELRKESRGQVDKNSEDRLEIRYVFYWGEKYSREGNSLRAQRLYQQVIKKSADIGWLRLQAKAYERIAYIAIKENRLEEGENLLKGWYAITKRNNDYRRLAFFERDYANLELAKGNYAESRVWAIKALKKFRDLKMETRVEIMESLVKKCDVHLGL